MMKQKKAICLSYDVKCKDGGVEPTNSLFSFDLEVPASFQGCTQ